MTPKFLTTFSKIALITSLVMSASLAMAYDESNGCIQPEIKGYAEHQIGCLSEGLVGVINDENKVGYLDKTGRVMIPFIYDPVPIAVEGGDWIASPFEEGMAIVSKTQPHEEYGEITYYGFIDKSGKPIIPIKYRDAANFSNGIAPVAIAGKLDKDGNPTTIWGFIDKSAKTVIPFDYEDAHSFSEGLAVVAKNGKYGVIDTHGKVVVPFKYEYIADFSEGLAGIYKGNGHIPYSDTIRGKFGYINKAGKVVIPMVHDVESLYDGPYIPSFENGKITIEKYQGEKDVSYCINKTGKKVTC